MRRLTVAELGACRGSPVFAQSLAVALRTGVCYGRGCVAAAARRAGSAAEGRHGALGAAGGPPAGRLVGCLAG